MSITHKYDPAAVQALLTSPNGGVAKDLLRRGLQVESAAKRNLSSNPKRVNTGRLRSDVKARPVFHGAKMSVRVGSGLKYALYVHDGTGLYGPHHKLIVPKNKKALKWKSKGGKGKKGYTYSKWSRGMRPNPFLQNALKAAKP
jgi:hypothetical protein